MGNWLGNIKGSVPGFSNTLFFIFLNPQVHTKRTKHPTQSTKWPDEAEHMLVRD